jgi:hypothetical protein
VPEQSAVGEGFGTPGDALPQATADPLENVITTVQAALLPVVKTALANLPETTDPVVIPDIVLIGGEEFVASDFSIATAAVTFTGSAGNDLVLGSTFNDVIDGSGGNDILSGGAGNDTLTGGPGNDTVFGGAGNDALIAGSGAGNDIYDGGTGVDTLIYTSTSQGITVNLAAGTASGPEIDSDTFVNIERFIGGSGNDTFFGGPGSFFIDGGAGSDTLSFASLSSSVTFDVAAGTVFGEGILTGGGGGGGTPTPVTLPISNITTANGASWFSLQNIGGLLGVVDATSGGSFGNSDHYDDALGIRVGGQAYAAGATILQDGNHFTANDQLLAGLNVTVDFNFFDDVPVVRQIVTLTNNIGSSISTDVSWINNSGADSSQQVARTSSGDLVAGLDDRYVVTTDGFGGFNEVDTFVMYGPGSPQVTTSTISLFENEISFGGAGNQGLTAGYNVTVGAGQTVFLMLFAGVNGSTAEGLGLATIFDDVSSAAFQNLISDLSGEQLSATVNWDVAGATNGTFTNIETLVGSSGDDVFENVGAGAKVQGDAGDDQFLVSNTSFSSLDGGAGFDTILFQVSGQTIDLTALPVGQITGVEALDITGSNDLVIDSSFVLAATSGTNAATGTAHTLVIDGSDGDNLIFSDAWNAVDGTTIGTESYTIFQSASSAATVFVNDNIASG